MHSNDWTEVWLKNDGNNTLEEKLEGKIYSGKYTMTCIIYLKATVLGTNHLVRKL